MVLNTTSLARGACNRAMVDEKGSLRNSKTFWFEEATDRGCPRRRA